ncbi:MAG: hypothetical protein O7H41_13370 [Planctomycetota bacterium]|nr:hypothetical protein [Planctomycetota bacterium]
MSDHPPLQLKPFILPWSRAGLEQVDDEIFVRLQEGQDTSPLAGTCYEVAVRECLRIAKDAFILKVRPELRVPLLSQLKEHCQAFRVFRSKGNPGSRILLTDQLSVRFASYATREQLRASLSRYFPGLADGEEPHDGIFQVATTYSGDPMAVSKALELDPLVLQAGPVSVAVAPSRGEEEKVDLLATR